jgi:hypothetical protein
MESPIKVKVKGSLWGFCLNEGGFYGLICVKIDEKNDSKNEEKSE